VFDQVVVPALLLAGRDRARGEIDEGEYRELMRALRSLIEPAPAAAPAAPSRRILGVSARTAADETLWDMFAQLVDPAKAALELAGSAYLAEPNGDGKAEAPQVLVVLSIPPGGLKQARYLCRRLRAKHPDTPIVVVRPSAQASLKEETTVRLSEDGATHVAMTLEDAQRLAQQHLDRA
jgi:hypothetical protein